MQIVYYRLVNIVPVAVVIRFDITQYQYTACELNEVSAKHDLPVKSVVDLSMTVITQQGYMSRYMGILRSPQSMCTFDKDEL